MEKKVKAGKGYLNLETGRVVYVHSLENKDRFGRASQLAQITEFRQTVFRIEDFTEEGGREVGWAPVSQLLYGSKSATIYPIWIESNFFDYHREVPDALVSFLPLEDTHA